MKTALPQTTQYIHRLLCATRQVEHKADLVSSFTQGRALSSRDMYEEEAQALVDFLQNGGKVEDKADKMRKKILSICHTMGWYKEGTKTLDYARIDAYCEKYSAVHKPLNKHTLQELPTLVSQFEAVLKSHLKHV